ncbi:MAG: recombinase family protein [Azoarcus sp.]|jgi:DNA invertase Pin-like site-specific DNA recombinase|nr:recombinase family protein [Azoarcus sp.]
MPPHQTVLYARVSTAEQTLEHQRTHAEKALGIEFDQVIADHGVSGITVKLKDRPEGKRLFDVLRKGDTLVVRWVDRLGRNYADVTDCIRELLRRGVTIKTVINGMVFEGSPKDAMQEAVRDALIAFMAATAQAQAEATKEAQKAGIEHAKELGAFKGRKPSFGRVQLDTVLSMLANKDGVQAIATATGLSRAAVYRIQEDPAKAHAALDAWGM